MRLRMLVGAVAGEIRDFSPEAARGALESGTAERVAETAHVFPEIRARAALSALPVARWPVPRARGGKRARV